MVETPSRRVNVELESEKNELGFGDGSKKCGNTETMQNIVDLGGDTGKYYESSKQGKTNILSTDLMSKTGDNQMPYSPPKRRKVDKDGFLTPATPEPPKSHFNKENDSHRLQDHLTQEVTSLFNQTTPQESEPIRTTSLLKESSSADDTGNTAKSVGEVVQGLGQEAKMMHSHWAQMFSQSEDVEHFMLTRLNQIMAEAKALESNLKQQKAELKGRLQDLLKTMET